MKCSVWIERSNGRYDGIFIHSNGGISGAGRILFSHWNSTEKVEKLISLGHLAKIEDSLEETVSYSRDRGQLMRYYKEYTVLQAKMVKEAYAYVWHPRCSVWTVGFHLNDPLLKTCVDML